MEAQFDVPVVGAALRVRLGSFGRATSLRERLEARTPAPRVVIDLDAEEIDLSLVPEGVDRP